MTRFARATGSKASNVRAPNEATPWHVMKEQLEENQAKNQKVQERVKSAKELLKEKEDLFCHDTAGDQNNWVEFEEVQSKKALKQEAKKQETKSVKPKVHKKEKKLQNEKSETVVKTKKSEHIVVSENTEQQPAQKAKVKKNKKKNSISEPSQENNIAQTHNVENSTIPNKKRKRTEDNSDEDKNANQEKLTKRQKRNLKRKNKDSDANGNPSEDTHRNSNRDTSFPQKFEKDFSNRQNGFNNDHNQFDKYPPKKIPKHNHTTPAKIRDDKEHARRKPEAGPMKLVINGIEVEVVKYDGFPVKKEDAERLKDLRRQMVMKGIPKKDIDAAMKLERRRAEKALARIRREVCYHCRKAGHVLSDCPELGAEQAGTGICFKCGSTEHTHFECKVARSTEYRFAKCFICREQGHISKQCPDNPKGVYPQGGACKVCGDVTHLKKDCPDLIKEKEETTLTLDTIADDTLEALDKEGRQAATDEKSTKKKVVKF